MIASSLSIFKLAVLQIVVSMTTSMLQLLYIPKVRIEEGKWPGSQRKGT